MPDRDVRRGSRVRLDQRVLELGLERSRTRAQARILAGDVRLGDRVMDKPGALVPADCQLVLSDRRTYVSRGGDKLAGALDAFDLDPSGLRCVDVGASTGGFTDCLLRRGARSVLAIDVGYGQLALSLRENPRVAVRERTNIRHYHLPSDEPLFELVTADLSFIGVTKVLPQLRDLAAPGAHLVILVKPQFELGRGEVGAGGVVRDPQLRLLATRRVCEAARALDLEVQGEVDSVLPGPRGNRERFVLLRRAPCGEAGLARRYPVQ